MSGASMPAARRHLRTRAVGVCPVCGGPGEPRYSGLVDRLLGVSGIWGVRSCRNAECGLLWLDPAPLDEDLPAAYEGYYTHDAAPPVPDTPIHRVFALVRGGYLTRRFGYAPVGHPALERLLSPLVHLVPGRREQVDSRIMYLHARPGGRVVDVGCGSGETLRALGDLGWRAEGVDFDAAAVARAREEGLRAEVGTLASQCYPDESLDAVTMSHVLEHVSDPIGLLREARRVLAPSGIIAVVTPNHESLGHRIFADRWRGLEPPRHLQVFSRRSLALAARRAGCETFEINTQARLAGMIWRESGRRLGMVTAPTGRAPWMRGRLLPGTFQVGERLLLAANSDLGEEIVLIARGAKGAS